MATSNPDTAPGGRLHLLGLPTELQTMIFDFAYQRSSDITLVSASEWRRKQSSLRQRAKPGDSPVTRPYPGSTVLHFLVSKRYFVAAARSYARSQAFNLDSSNRPASSKLESSFLPGFAREVVAYYGASRFWNLPSVRVLRLTVYLYMFNVDDEKEVELPVLKRLLTAEDFAKSPMCSLLDNMRGIKQLELIPQDLSMQNLSEEQQANWFANVKMLETVVRLKVTAAFEVSEGEVQVGPTPLYPGSKVFFETPCHKALPGSTPLYPHIDILPHRSWPKATPERAVQKDLLLHCVTEKLKDMAIVDRTRVEKVYSDLMKPASMMGVESGGAVKHARKDKSAVSQPVLKKPEAGIEPAYEQTKVKKSVLPPLRAVKQKPQKATSQAGSDPIPLGTTSSSGKGIWFSNEEFSILQKSMKANDEKLDSTKQRMGDTGLTGNHAKVERSKVKALMPELLANLAKTYGEINAAQETVQRAASVASQPLKKPVADAEPTCEKTKPEGPAVPSPSTVAAVAATRKKGQKKAFKGAIGIWMTEENFAALEKSVKADAEVLEFANGQTEKARDQVAALKVRIEEVAAEKRGGLATQQSPTKDDFILRFWRALAIAMMLAVLMSLFVDWASSVHTQK